MRRHISVLCLLLVTAGHAEVKLIDDFRYPEVAALRDAWAPLPGTPPADFMPHGNKDALRITCPFATVPALAGCSYDREVALDLTGADAISLDFYVDDPAALTSCAIFFHSGDGWYCHPITPVKGWQHLNLPKGTFGVEGQPGGWDRVDIVRISAYRAKPLNTYCGFDNLQARTDDTGIAFIAGTGSGANALMVRTFTELASGYLGKAGVPFIRLTEREVESGALARRKLAIFPLNPDLSPQALERIRDFVDGGGKIIFFFALPEPMAKLLGVTNLQYRQPSPGDQFREVASSGVLPELPTMGQHSWGANLFDPSGPKARIAGQWQNAAGEKQGNALLISDNGAYLGHVLTGADPAGKQAFLLALVGHFVPAVWEEAARLALERAERVGPYTERAELERYLASANLGQALADRVKGSLAQAEVASAQATQLLADGQFSKSIAAARQLHDSLAEAYFVAHKPRTAEFRAAWDPSGTGGSATWDEAMRRLKEANFHAVIPNLWSGGLADYDSKLLPHSATFNQRGDQIAQCVAAGKKYGIQVHAWKINLKLAAAPAEFEARMRAEGRLLVNGKGEMERELCPSNPLNLQLEIDTMLEVVSNYDVDGIHFDYIRYPHDDGCYCSGCRQQFEERLGRRVANWPQDCRGPLKEEWMQFRCDNITRLVRTVSERARKLKPGLKISAAVFWNYPQTKYTVGQDWVLWCKQHYLDFVCPMSYTDNDAWFAAQVSNHVNAAASAIPVYSGIGAWQIPDDQTVGQIEIARGLGADGFVLWVEDLATYAFPKFAEGITSQPAVIPHEGPQVQFTSPADVDGKETLVAGGELAMKIEMLGPGSQRQQVAAVTGKLQLEDVTGQKLTELDDLPALGQSAEVRINVTKWTGIIRVAAVGTMTFADGTKAPFVVRSRPYSLRPSRTN
ncbi:MAG: family 10 glycosylhydrolase [Armatimonadia bacterium]